MYLFVLTLLCILYNFAEIFDKQSDDDHDYYGVFSDECDAEYDNDEIDDGKTYWLGSGSNPYGYFSIDLKAQVHINKVILRNSEDGDDSDS